MANEAKGSQETTVTLEEQVNNTLATADENGKIDFGNEVDPIFKQLVLTEKRSRAHQAKAITTHKENTSLKATNQVLSDTINSSTQLTAEQADELEDLKLTDVDAWFTKKQQYEQEGQVASANKLKELTTEASTKALADLTLNERKDAVADFQTRTGIALTDDVMKNDIPPRLQAKMNTMPFDDYLTEVATYLGKGKKITQTDDSLDQTNLGDLAGGGDTKANESGKYTIL